MHELLQDYSVTLQIPVAWGDMDAFQHVNNVAYFRYFENARIAYTEKINGFQFMKDTGFGSILATASCRFRFPLTFPDTALTGIRISEMSEDRYTMQFRIVSQRHQKIAAEGDSIVVSYDYNQLQKMPVPEVIRARILALEPSLNN